MYDVTDYELMIGEPGAVARRNPPFVVGVGWLAC